MTPTGSANNPDQALILRAQQGDLQAFSELVCCCQEGTINVVYRMCGDRALAEEAAQEAFVRVWQHLAAYRPEHSFRAWLYRIAINAGLDALRRDQPRSQHGMRPLALDDVPEEALPPAGAPEPESVLEARQRAGQVRRAVLALPDHTRAVVVLREYGGLSYAEIAAALNIPLGTVMSRLNSARGQLRQALAGLLEAP